MSEIPDFLKKEYETSEKRKDVIQNTSVYRFFDEHKTVIRIICVIAIIGVIFIGSSIHKLNYINSLYEHAVEYQEKEDYSTALYCLDKILDKDANNKKAKKLYPIVEEAAHKQGVENSLKSAVDYKNDGKYISAYNYAQSAYSNAEKYGYTEEKATAEQLMNELRPLKEQQESEKAAQDKANEEARKEKKQNDIQTLVNTYVFDGELAVKILQANDGYSSGIYMYGQRSNDADGNYYPIAHKSNDYLNYWFLYKVYENGNVQSNGMEEKVSGYKKAVGAESVTKNQEATKTDTVKKSSTVGTVTNQPENKSTANSSNNANKSQHSSNSTKSNSSTNSGTQSMKLDNQFHGEGYSVSYPSSFMVQQEKEYMFAVLDPSSGSNVTIINLSVLGNFNDFITSKENAESLFQEIAIGTIESKVQSGHLNGYKCYECKIKTFEGTMTTQYITGDNDSLYLICIAKGNGISSTNSKTLDEVLQSFKLEN